MGTLTTPPGKRLATFAEKESICEFIFREEGPFWHLATPGRLQQSIFITDDDYRFGMSSAAICAAETGITVYAHTLMGNHIHDIAAGTRDRCLTYISRRRQRLQRYLNLQGRNMDISAFDCEPIPITSLQMLRNEIVYVHRNGYVVNSAFTPFSYPWSTGIYYYNPYACQDRGVPYSSLTYKAKRNVFHGRTIELPGEYRFKDGYMFPPSYCRIVEGERMFRDAHQYFNLLSKNYEAYSEEARRLGDIVVLTDEEMYPAVRMECRRRFGARKYSELDLKDKVSLAKVMHEDYSASNSQIQRILNIDIHTVNSLFPLRNH